MIKPLINSALKFAMNKAKQSKLMQSLFEQPIEVNKMPEIGHFIDHLGRNHILYHGFRSKIKPGWEYLVQSDFKSQLPTDDNFVLRKINDSRIIFDKLIPSLEVFSFKLQNSNCLEIGCHSGALSFQLAENGAASVTATEFSGYKIQSVEGTQSKSFETVNDELKVLRTKVGEGFKNAAKVRFLDDDICNSRISIDEFDLICSWDVLEHVADPAGAIHHISRLLRKGGIAFHEYNPFFSLNGGHSLCTLDFPWGHCRLSADDFVTYLNQFRPKEIEPATQFFKDGLNRLTQNNLIELCRKENLEILSFLPFPKEQHFRMLNFEIVSQAQELYPGLEIIDLVSPRVVIILRKIC
jgi:2-polyprenyl-3-methyl-5-hydroxy-6-metoxy-1,4-benzoquinol methylase